jgi:hypothetical protein
VSVITSIALALVLGTSGRARATGSLVVDGGFESTTNGTGEIGPNGITQLTYWTTTDAPGNTSGYTYSFVYGSGTGDTTGAYDNQYNGYNVLYGPMPASSPSGGNFIGADGTYETAVISQTISGLTANDTYALNFYFAGAQQTGYTGATTEQWQVSLGTETLSTAVLDNSSQGFTGWQAATLDFTATGASEVLSFMAVGAPNGLPPFLLLDGVTMNAVPEPSTFVLVGIGLLGAGAVSLRRRFKSAQV